MVVCSADGPHECCEGKTIPDTGADVNARDNYGETPLHRAAYKGHVAAVRALMSGGANVNAKNKEGRTSVDTARLGMNKTEESIEPFQKTIEILRAHGGAEAMTRYLMLAVVAWCLCGSPVLADPLH